MAKTQQPQRLDLRIEQVENGGFVVSDTINRMEQG